MAAKLDFIFVGAHVLKEVVKINCWCPDCINWDYDKFGYGCQIIFTTNEPYCSNYISCQATKRLSVGETFCPDRKRRGTKKDPGGVSQT